LVEVRDLEPIAPLQREIPEKTIEELRALGYLD
jgi:hypothetical protein